jgi:excinuclease ABC subunit C
MTSQEFKKLNLPDSPGVYFFKKNKKILYVGKATSLYDRTKSYFSRDLINTRGLFLVRMIKEADSIKFEKTDSVLEALILEANYIKEYQPLYNTKEKDDKSYNYVVITDESFPRILIERGRNLVKAESRKLKSTFGPFPNGGQLKEAVKIVRKIFPFRDKCIPYGIQKEKFENRRPLARLAIRAFGCFNHQIGLCPGVCTGEVSQREYATTVRNIELFFKGKKKQIVKNLEREMKLSSKNLQFERAQEAKSKIFALNHIRDVSLIRNEQLTTNNLQLNSNFRIEAYDIAHMSGQDTVGVMVVMENGELAKNEYRKFIIRGSKGRTLNSVSQGSTLEINDTKNLKEIFTRRLNHREWRFPNLIVVDGGVAQINIIKEVVKENNLYTKIVSVVKDDKHKAKEILGSEEKKKYKREILLINSEAHRFAIAYHKKRRGKTFILGH